MRASAGRSVARNNGPFDVPPRMTMHGIARSVITLDQGN